MPDFLDRFGDQLYAAQHTGASPAVAGGRRARVWRGGRRRGLVAIGAVLAVGAPAVAVVGPWDPDLERFGVDRPVTTDDASVNAAAVNALGRAAARADGR